ncbi:MAG TPA: hypothetical protein VGN27_04875 [Gaiellaceae bacterium]|nr:hypothetical protein [Gaiellaceae bacterium]
MTDGGDAPRDYCPSCGAAYEPLQEYCLECGARLPTNRGVVGFLASEWQRRLAWYPGDWIWPVLLFLVITVVATAAAVAAASTSKPHESAIVATTPSVTVGPGAPQPTVVTQTPTSTLPTAPQPTITTGTLPAAPGAPSTSSTTTPAPTTNPNALTSWPAGRSGYTNVLESLPVTAGRPAAFARARAAKRAGLPDVGVLISAEYSSLHPGYYVVFSGVYGSQSEASAAVSAVHAHGFPDAYQTRVTR